MARSADSPGSTLALACLSAAAALALTRVFEAGSWRVALLAVAVSPHGLLWLVQRRGWSGHTTLAAAVVGGVFATVWIVFPATTWNGLPTADTLGRLLDALRDAPETLRAARVPVAASGTGLFLAVTATWSAAALAHWLATRLEATVAALVPTLTLYVVVSALGKGPWVWTAVVYALAAGAFLALQHEQLLARRRASFHSAGGHGGILIAATAVTATLVAVAVGALVAPQLPGAGSEPWFDYREFGEGDGDGRLTIISPLVDIRSSLLQQDPAELFRVRADRGAYWRLIALEDFDGRIWGLSDDSAPANEALQRLALPITTIDLEQEVRITRLGGQLLPAAYAPVRITAGGARVLPATATIVREVVEPGLTYRVTSQYPAPTAAELDAAGATVPAGAASLAELPGDFPDRVADLAARVTEGAGSPYRRLLALQAFFRDPANFTYSLSVPPGHGTSDIERFLFETRAGYCEQFAGTFAAMARSLGFPARVAVGFQPGRIDPRTGEYVVTGVEAHAWPEVYLEGAGWTSFEPTPGRFEPSPNDHTGTRGAAPPPSTDPSDDPTTSTPTTAAAGGQGTPGRDTNPNFPDLGEVRASAPDAGDGPARPLWRRAVDAAVLDSPARSLLWAAAAVVGATLAFAGHVVARKLVRTRRRRHAADTRVRVRGAWDDARERLAEAGITSDPALTPSEFALRRAAAQGAGAAGPPLVQLAQLVTHALYAPEPPSEADADAAWRHAVDVERRLRAGTTAGVRLRRRLDWKVLRASTLDPARRS
jgi:transglutaminase-like putative cysteine protease